MKTTIIQDDSNELKPERSETREEVGARRHPTNLSGRMGRWSAHHRKMAIFGWLAFVVASFFVGSFVIGAKQATDTSGPGESGRALTILDDGFKQPASRVGAGPERHAEDRLRRSSSPRHALSWLRSNVKPRS